MAIFCPTGPTNRSRPIANLFNFYVLVQFGWNLVSGLRLSCYFPAPFMLLFCSYSTPSRLQLLPCPCRTLALLLPYYCPAHFKLLSGTFLAPPQVLPSSCPLSALFCFTLLSSATALFLPCSCPAHTSTPLLLCSSPAPGPANPSLAAFIISTLQLFLARQEPPFMVSNGFESKKSLKSGFQGRKILEIKVFKAENPWNQGFQGSNSCLTLKSRFSRKMLFAEEWAQIFFSSLQKYAKRLTQHKNEALWAADLGIIEKILLCRKSYKDLLCIFVLEITENLEIKVFKAVWPWFLDFQVYPAVFHHFYCFIPHTT